MDYLWKKVGEGWGGDPEDTNGRRASWGPGLGERERERGRKERERGMRERRKLSMEDEDVVLLNSYSLEIIFNLI